MTAKSASGDIRLHDLLAARHHHRLLPLDGLRILEPRPASPRNVLPVLCLRERGLYGDCLGVALIPSNPMGFNPVEIHGLRAGGKSPPPLCELRYAQSGVVDTESRFGLRNKRQQTSEQTPQAEPSRRTIRLVPLDVADAAIRPVNEAKFGRSVHCWSPPFIFCAVVKSTLELLSESYANRAARYFLKRANSVGFKSSLRPGATVL